MKLNLFIAAIGYGLQVVSAGYLRGTTRRTAADSTDSNPAAAAAGVETPVTWTTNVLDEEDDDDRFHVQLTPENFESFNQRHDAVFVEYCSPRSGMCRFANAEWESFALQARALELPVAIGQVDCAAYPLMCKAQNIRAFPTFRWQQKTEQSSPTKTKKDFHGKLTASSLLELTRLALEEQVIQLTPSNFDDFAARDAVVIEFCSPRNPMCQYIDQEVAAFAKQAHSEVLPIAIGKVDCAAYPRLCASHDVAAYPTIRWQRSWEGTATKDFHGKITSAFLLQLAKGELQRSPARV